MSHFKALRGVKIFKKLLVFGLLSTFISSCGAPHISQGNITVSIKADGKNQIVSVQAGSSVADSLTAAGIVMSTLDRTEPPLYTLLKEGSQVRLVRVREEFSVEQVVIPYEQQTVRNESLPVGIEYLLQSGQKGLQELTTRHVYEDGIEVTSHIINAVVIKEPIPQITMVGVQKPFSPISIPGRIAYILDGDVWIMEGTTNLRQQLVNTGDLDGRVFSLSPDGAWLLFTRTSQEDADINSLWVARVDSNPTLIIDLGVSNIVHFADWKPGSVQTIAYSTVEPRAAAPGWQANNDLQMLTFSSSGEVRQLPVILEANSGGLYGWWGMNFAWSPDGLRLGYARPDSIGSIDLQSHSQTLLLEMAPYQTYGDWAWVPGITWGADGEVIYSVQHHSAAETTTFNLIGLSPMVGISLNLKSDVGMFAYPVVSPMQDQPTRGINYQVAYLQALYPHQSDSGRYQLIVMDRDGSNQQVLFPTEGTGLEPQKVVWSPQKLNEQDGYAIAVIYQNNLWLVEVKSGIARQITGDGLTTRVDWK